MSISFHKCGLGYASGFYCKFTKNNICEYLFIDYISCEAITSLHFIYRPCKLDMFWLCTFPFILNEESKEMLQQHRDKMHKRDSNLNCIGLQER